MYDEVCGFEQDIRFTIGFAGSGKSSLLAKRITDDDMVLTPTHKAADVLRAKGIKNVYTIHSILGLVPTLNMNYVPGKHRMQKLKKVGNTDLQDIKSIYIDEYGMLSTEILDTLLEALPKCIVHLFGDEFQLSTIEGDKIKPVEYSDNIERLTIQYRSEAPEIVETFMRFQKYIEETTV